MSLPGASIEEIEAARRLEPSGARARAMVRAGDRLHERLREGAIARRLEVLAIDRAPCRIATAITGARARGWAILERRALFLELDLEGQSRRVLVDPVARGSWRRTPWGAWWEERHTWRAARIGARDRSIEDALAAISIDPASIDLAILTQLRGVDLRALLGSGRGDGLEAPSASIFPRARWIIARAALEAAADPHDAERPFLVRDGLERIDRSSLTAIDRDAWLGSSTAIIATPGWSAGNASVFVHTARGVLGWSSHGAARGAWSPYHAGIDGLRELVREEDLPCAPRADAISREDALSSMSLERAIVDRDPGAPATHLIEPRERLVA